MAALLESADDSLMAALAVVEPDARAAVNEWLAYRAAPILRIDDKRYELRWLADADVRWHVAVEWAVGAYRGVLALDGLVALDPLLVGEPFTLMPAPMRDLAVHRFVARLLASAPRALSHALEIRAVHWDPPSLLNCSCRLPFSIREHSGGAQALGMLAVETAAGLQWLHQALPVERGPVTRLDPRFGLRMEIGRSTLSAADLRRLDAGDVVWIETASHAREGIALELAGAAGRTWRCRVKHHSLRIITIDDSTAATSRTAAAVRDNDMGVSNMGAERWQVDVPVTFDLGELKIRLEDLERLQPGHIIDLPQDVSTAVVSVRVAGGTIAEGTLIAIGKRLGVRLTRILAPRESVGAAPAASA